MSTAQTEARAVESVRKWLDGGCSSWGLPSQQIEMLLSALAAKDAEIAALKKEAADVVRPFAEHLDKMKFDRDNHGNLLPDEQTVGWVYVTNGHFRAARSFLDKWEGRE